jgi:hypothetical protein
MQANRVVKALQVLENGEASLLPRLEAYPIGAFIGWLAQHL